MDRRNAPQGREYRDHSRGRERQQSTRRNQRIKRSQQREIIRTAAFTALTVVVLCLSFFQGGGLWAKIHNLFLGLFGSCSAWWAVIPGILAIAAAFDQKRRLRSSTVLIWGAGCIFVICTAVFLFGLDKNAEKISYIENMTQLYLDGIKGKGSGSVGGLIGLPIFGLLGAVGAKIVMILVLLASVLILLIKKSGMVGRKVSGVASSFLGNTEDSEPSSLREEEPRRRPSHIPPVTEPPRRTGQTHTTPRMASIDVPLDSEPSVSEESSSVPSRTADDKVSEMEEIERELNRFISSSAFAPPVSKNPPVKKEVGKTDVPVRIPASDTVRKNASSPKPPVYVSPYAGSQSKPQVPSVFSQPAVVPKQTKEPPVHPDPPLLESTPKDIPKNSPEQSIDTHTSSTEEKESIWQILTDTADGENLKTEPPVIRVPEYQTGDLKFPEEEEVSVQKEESPQKILSEINAVLDDSASTAFRSEPGGIPPVQRISEEIASADEIPPFVEEKSVFASSSLKVEEGSSVEDSSLEKREILPDKSAETSEKVKAEPTEKLLSSGEVSNEGQPHICNTKKEEEKSVISSDPFGDLAEENGDETFSEDPEEEEDNFFGAISAALDGMGLEENEETDLEKEAEAAQEKISESSAQEETQDTTEERERAETEESAEVCQLTESPDGQENVERKASELPEEEQVETGEEESCSDCVEEPEKREPLTDAAVQEKTEESSEQEETQDTTEEQGGAETEESVETCQLTESPDGQDDIEHQDPELPEEEQVKAGEEESCSDCGEGPEKRELLMDAAVQEETEESSEQEETQDTTEGPKRAETEESAEAGQLVESPDGQDNIEHQDPELPEEEQVEDKKEVFPHPDGSSEKLAIPKSQEEESVSAQKTERISESSDGDGTTDLEETNSEEHLTSARSVTPECEVDEKERLQDGQGEEDPWKEIPAEAKESSIKMDLYPEPEEEPAVENTQPDPWEEIPVGKQQSQSTEERQEFPQQNVDKVGDGKETDSRQKLEFTENGTEDPWKQILPGKEEKTLAQPENSFYRYPPFELLEYSKEQDSQEMQEELKGNGDRLISTLKSFGVQTTMCDISRGPAVTRYELQPAAGVKISKITNLADDIAMNLAASGVRIEAPIPGKAAVGIEVPNKSVNVVRMRELVESEEFQKAESPLTVVLGRDIAGKITIANLAKMPHLLIAGSTGSGKSVCINSLIVSLLYKSSPEEVRFLMIDPKVVELGIYNGIPHLLVPVVTDPRKAAGALNWAVSEMLKRYQLFADNSVRDLAAYNKIARENNYIDADGQPMPAMPQIVIIIDELADLMMAAPNEVEDAICRLAQMARAAGMHLVIATQRPSVDVITGIIKANIPSRIAFAVSSQIDSRTILDMGGAEKLLGRGDMLFSPMGVQKPMRVQGCFVSDHEIEEVVRFVKGSCDPLYDSSILEEIEKNAIRENDKGSEDDGGSENMDPMLQDAIKCVAEAGQASASLLQRRLRLGYARAGRLIDEMEDMGIIGPREGSKPRQVLITYQQYLEMSMNREPEETE